MLRLADSLFQNYNLCVYLRSTLNMFKQIHENKIYILYT